LGSDTSVIVDNQILGKPESKSHFIEMMNLLSGRKHQVLTSIALVSSAQEFADVITTDVYFIPLSATIIDQYWATGEPKDKAGGYGIQGFGSALVAQIQGSYSAVVGLPLHQTAKILSKAGLPIWNGALLL
jgi:septum formation protein